MTNTKFKPGDTCWARRGNPTEPVVILEVEINGMVHYAYKDDADRWNVKFAASSGRHYCDKDAGAKSSLFDLVPLQSKPREVWVWENSAGYLLGRAFSTKEGAFSWFSNKPGKPVLFREVVE